MEYWNQLEEKLEAEQRPVDRACVKIFNGPAGVIPGLEQLHIDRFADHLFVLSYREFSEEEKERLISLLGRLYPDCSLRLQYRAEGSFHEQYISEDAPERIIVEEGGLRFIVHSGRGQNTGFFADMKNGRARVREYCASLKAAAKEDVRVLNLFAYTCSFSVAALSGGADHADNWDMNRNSLNIGKENHGLNGLDERSHSYFAYDIFKSFSKIGRRGPYDLVILDPPPYQGRSFSWKKDYPRLMQRLPRILKAGGGVLFCLNASDCGAAEFREMIEDRVPGAFGSIEALSCPPEYLGRYPDRGLKTFFADDYREA